MKKIGFALTATLVLCYAIGQDVSSMLYTFLIYVIFLSRVNYQLWPALPIVVIFFKNLLSTTSTLF